MLNVNRQLGIRENKKTMRVLILEKINHRFQKMTGNKQNCGLSICTGMIAESFEGISVAGFNDLTEIERMLQKHRPKAVIFEALSVKAESLRNIRATHKHTKFYVHLHSNLAFLAIEHIAFSIIHSFYKEGMGVIFNNESAYRAFENIPNTYYLPNIYSKQYLEIKQKEESDYLDIGCFGSVRPMKNHITQAAAASVFAKKLGKKLRFHLNMNRSEDNGQFVAKNLMNMFNILPNCALVNQPWKSHDEFIKSIQSMDLVMQLSLSESFNIVTADAVAAGVPMVVSREIEWADELSKSSHSNIDEIVKVMEMNFKNRVIINMNRAHLFDFHFHAKNKWHEFLKSHE